MKPISIKEFSRRLAGETETFRSPEIWKRLTGIFSAVLVRLLSEGKAVNLPGVGTLYPATRAARRKKCGLTGEVLDWPEMRTVKFRASEVVKRELNK